MRFLRTRLPAVAAFSCLGAHPASPPAWGRRAPAPWDLGLRSVEGRLLPRLVHAWLSADGSGGGPQPLRACGASSWRPVLPVALRGGSGLVGAAAGQPGRRLCPLLWCQGVDGASPRAEPWRHRHHSLHPAFPAAHSADPQPHPPPGFAGTPDPFLRPLRSDPRGPAFRDTSPAHRLGSPSLGSQSTLPQLACPSSAGFMVGASWPAQNQADPPPAPCCLVAAAGFSGIYENRGGRRVTLTVRLRDGAGRLAHKTPQKTAHWREQERDPAPCAV